MKKISVIIPCNDKALMIERCIKSIVNQSYNNLEIIVVDDCCEEKLKSLLEKYSIQDNRVKVLRNDSKSRIIGSQHATGDYISFVDSSDYIDPDYFRLLVESAENNQSDIVISNCVKYKDEYKYISSLQYDTNNKTYEGSIFLDRFFHQAGRNIRIHTLPSKLLKMSLWIKAIDDCAKMDKNITMAEDLLFSAIAFYYARRVTFCDAAFYYKNDISQTEDQSTIKKSVDDITYVFDFIKSFYKEKKLFHKYEKNIESWKSFYISKYINACKKGKKKSKELDNYILNTKLTEITKEIDKSLDNYSLHIVPFSEELIDIKKKIMDPDIKVISFDMFDTLVLRPFFVAADMFFLLNKDFHRLFHTMGAVDFSEIRKKSEIELRNINNKKNILETTIDDIYEYIAKKYSLNTDIIEKIKVKELELEEKFCYIRKTGYELYSLAKHLNKRVILTSDIYLPKETLQHILKKWGYSFDEYYISSELRKTKSSKELFKYVIKKEKTEKMLHIGDNYISDVEIPKELGIDSAYLPRTIDVMMGFTNNNVGHCGNLYKYFYCFNIDHVPYEENYGVRCSISLIANYYFDNPFRPFNENSDFNSDPYFIGYYTLGMQTLSLCKWLMEDTVKEHIDSIAFMARDGFLPYKALKVYNNILKVKNAPKMNYVYVSRKSLMPLLLKDKNGISMIDSYLNIDMVSPNDLIKQFDCIFTISKDIEKTVSKLYPLDEKFKSRDEFNACLAKIYDLCFDSKKYDQYYRMCKEYFEKEYFGNTATFDIGYSAKPEAIISSILEKPITTYFIHTNNSSAYKYSRISNFPLKTFYDYKPTLTGTTRELFISYVGPSCIGYEYKNGEVVPIFGTNKHYDYFNIDMIEKIQQGALDFVKDFTETFKEYIDIIDLNKYYMSIPMEYYYNYAKDDDTLPTKDILFDDNVNYSVELNDYIARRYIAYKTEYSIGKIPERITPDVNCNLPTPKNKWKKWQDKINYPESLPKSKIKKAIYYIIFHPRELLRKIKHRIIK